MVDKIFHIEGEKKQIFDAGFRAALMGKASEYGIKALAVNEEHKVTVITNGDAQRTELFHNHIKNNDIRSIQTEPPNYDVENLEDYTGEVLDWNDYKLGFISEQISKLLTAATTLLGGTNSSLTSIDTKLDNVDNKLSSIDTKLDTMDTKFGVIGETLQKIDKKLDVS